LGHLTRKTVPEMTYNVFSGTLNHTHSLSLLSSVEALIMCVVVEFAGYITNCSVFGAGFISTKQLCIQSLLAINKTD